MARQIAVIGGGPAGLTTALLIKLREPSCDVSLFERQLPESTFGYGVGVSWRVLDAIRELAPDCVAALEAASLVADRWTIQRDGESISVDNGSGTCIGRRVMLETMREYAAKAGVDIRQGVEARVADVADADVVIGADGVASLVRTDLADQLGVTTTRGELSFIWCGTDTAPRGMTLSIARTPAGPMAAHMVAHGHGATFQVDAHQDVVAALGLDGEDPERNAATLSFLEDLYTELLAGSRLVVKRPVWQQFDTTACERWYHGNTVLLGDAVHTAHYTVGSGTGLALEDAIVLAEALTGAGSVDDAFASYTAIQQPRVHQLQSRAARSQLWWTALGQRMDMPLPVVMLSYLSRTGALPLSAIASANPKLISRCLDDHMPDADPVEAALSLPFEGRVSRVCASDEVTSTIAVDGSPTPDSLRTVIESGRALRAEGTESVRIVGPTGLEAVLDRLEVAEQLRTCAKLTTVVTGSAADRETLAMGVLTERTDLVEIS